MANRTPVPELTDEQRALAARNAVYIRQLRAYHKGLLKDGYITFEEFLNVPSVQRMHVEEALRAVPGIGPKRAAGIMERAGIAQSRRVQGLGCRQRERLLAEVADATGRLGGGRDA